MRGIVTCAPRSTIGAALAFAILSPGGARAESREVRIGQIHGLTYLATYVVAERKLIQQHAARAGLGDVTVTLTTTTNAGAAGDLILSGSVDVGALAMGQLLTLWDKTRGAQKVRAIMPTAISHLYLVTIDPRIKSIRDFTDGDRIAMSAIRSGLQAMMLQMAVVKEYGWDQRFKLDPLTVAMPPAEATVALQSGRLEVKSHMTLLPFSAIEKEIGARVVMSSVDITGPGSSSVVVTTEKFHNENPKLYAAIVAAYEEALAFIDANKRAAAEIYVKYEPQKRGVEWIQKILEDESEIKFTSVPKATQVYADFMFRLGTMKNHLDSWKDVYWDNVAGKDGN